MSLRSLVFLLMMGTCLSCSMQSRKSLDPVQSLERVPADLSAESAQSDNAELWAPTDYILQAGDRLDVSFPYAREQSFSCIVRPDGRITSPILGDVDAEGLSPTRLSQSLTVLYKEHLQNSQAQVIVTSFGPQPVYIFGEVQKPARYDWSRGLDLVQILSLAGGPLRTAEMGNVLVLHVSPEGAYRYDVFDLKNLLEDQSARAVYLRPRDIVIVPTSTIADMGIWVDQHINTFIPPIDGFLRGRYYWFLANDRNN
jgi:polysaccharide export outer membrane protein